MSPYLRKVRTASGATAVQVVDKSNGRRTILEHLGSAHDDAELAALMEVGRTRLRPGQQVLDLDHLVRPGASAPVAVAGRRSCDLLWQVLTRCWQTLGLDEAVGGDEAFKQMVLARLVEPVSKADTIRVITELGVHSVGLRTLFRSLSRCVEQDWRASIERALYQHVAADASLSLVLYDVTTLYFETDKDDELRKVGFSKERRVDPQVTVGMLTDRTGFALQVGCWQGNKAETRTIIPMVNQFLQAHGIDPHDLVVVADAGMLSHSNLTALDEAGLGFIVGSKTTRAPYDLAEHTHFHGDAYQDGQLIETTTPKTGLKDLAGQSMRRDRPAWTPQASTGHWRVVWHYSARRFARDNATLSAQENKARAVIDGHRAARRPRFVTGRAQDLSLDQTALARARAAAGLKGYVTNITAQRMHAAQVVSTYKQLWHVEASWRMSKHDLRARPVFHHTRDAIEAHLTIVMAALAVAHHLQDATGMSIKRVINALKPLQSVEVTIAGHTLLAQPQLTTQAAHIIKAINLPGH